MQDLAQPDMYISPAGSTMDSSGDWATLGINLGCLGVQALQPGEASSEEEDEGQLQEERPTSGSSKLAYTQEQANLRSSFLQVCTTSIHPAKRY